MVAGQANDEEMTPVERWKTLSWHALAQLPEQERDEALVAKFNSLADLSEKWRKIDLETMASVSADLPNDKAVAFTRSRLRARLRMDPHQAEVVAASYEIAIDNVPANAAWKRVTLVQQAVMRFMPEEQHKLHLLFPREVPAATVKPLAEKDGVASQEATEADVVAGSPEVPMNAYCLKCKAKREIRNPSSVTFKNGTKAMQGTCPVCGTKLFRTGKG